MKLAEKNLVLVAAWMAVLLGGWSLAQRAVVADEPNCPCKLRVELKASEVPILAKLPYLGQLFVSPASCGHSACESHVCSEDGLERIGVDFDLPSVPATWFYDNGEFFTCCIQCAAANCAEPKCGEDCVADVEVAKAEAPAECVQSGCAASGCCPAAGQCEAVACEKGQADASPANHFTQCQSQMVDLIVENAHLHASIEAKELLLDAQRRMLEQFVEFAQEKAQLQARLEVMEKVMAEREKTFNAIHELACENARLKSEMETLAREQGQHAERHELALDNERLKARLAHFEGDEKTSSEARVAKKARIGRKTR